MMFELLGLFGITAGQFLTGAGVISGGIAAKMAMDMDTARKDREKRMSEEEYNEMIKKKKQIEMDLFNESQQRDNETIKKSYDQMQVDKKERELKEYKLVENMSLSVVDYTGIKVIDSSSLLLGHDYMGLPVWGTDPNYIFAGSTRCGKTRKLYSLLLNFLVNNQGYVFLGDLKEVDFAMFKDCKNVVKYVNKLNNIKEIVEGFKDECDRRRQLFASAGVVNLEAYNNKTGEKLRNFMLLIDEYADVSDAYKDRNGNPSGVYLEIIGLARTCAAFGGRVVLGTQRPSVDVVCGTLKNNCSIIGMKCINGLNSNIMIGTDGCERLAKTEALTIIDGNLMKVFSYRITDERLSECISKLK